MSIPVSCPSCGYQTNAPDNTAGKRSECPKCGGIIQVPDGPQVIDAEVVDAELAGPSSTLPLVTGAIPVSPEFATQDGSSTDNRRPCPVCGEMIPVGALKCRFCNEIFDPELKKQEAKKGKSSFSGGEGDKLTAGEWVVAILCSGIGCIVGIIWMVQGKPKGKKMFLISFGMQLLWALVRGIIVGAGGNNP